MTQPCHTTQHFDVPEHSGRAQVVRSPDFLFTDGITLPLLQTVKAGLAIRAD